MIEYGARRLMALFHAYEAFPHHPEFVRLSVMPLIKAELEVFVSRLMSFDRISIYQLQSVVQNLYHDALAMRQLMVVQGLVMQMPKPQDEEKLIRITWNLFFHPNVQHFLEIPVRYYTQYELDEKYSNASNHLHNVTKLLQDTGNT